MFPSSLSLLDLADITWETIARSPTLLCIRSPLQIASGKIPDVSVVAWSLGQISNLTSVESRVSARWFSRTPPDLATWQCWSRECGSTTEFVACISTELFLDGLVTAYGRPPDVILRDWNRQASTASKSTLLERPLSSIVVGSDGLLCSILDVFSEYPLGTQVSDSPTTEQLNKLADLLTAATSLTSVPGLQQHGVVQTSTQTLSDFLESNGVTRAINSAPSLLSNESPLQNLGTTSPAIDLFTRRDPLAGKEPAPIDLKQTAAPKHNKSPIARPSWSARRIALSVIVLLVAGLGLAYALLSGKSTPGKSTNTSGSSNVASAPDRGATLNLQPDTDAAITVVEPSEAMVDANPELKLTEGTSTREVQSVASLNTDLASELSAKLMEGMKSESGADSSIDPSKIESITSLLSAKAPSVDAPTNTESQMKSDSELKSLDASFNDSGENAPAMDPQAMTADSPAVEVPMAPDEQPGVSKAVTIALKRPVQKEELRIAFSVNPKVAAVQVQWELPAEVLITPEAPVLITGKHEQTWKIALKDESSRLAVTVKSKPSRKWLLGIVVKLQNDNGAEFPIAPGDAKVMEQQLNSRAKELMQQIQFLEQVKGSKDGRAFASYYMPLAEASLKQTETALKQWIEIDQLVDQFYKTHKLNVTFHANVK